MMALEDQFSGRRYINLESYDKNGKAKKTPVQSLEEHGRIYVRTDPKTWKVKRITEDPHVRIALCDRNGKPLGAWFDGEAQVIQDKKLQDQIQLLFQKHYGSLGSFVVDFVARLRGEKLTSVIMIKLSPPFRSTAE
jgi:uncharacterized protein